MIAHFPRRVLDITQDTLCALEEGVTGFSWYRFSTQPVKKALSELAL